MGKLVMGYWDCPYCGTQEIPGNVETCPSCGRGRGDVKFYMKNHAEQSTRDENDRSDIEYVSEEEAQKVNRNPDWYCSFCHTLNHDDAKFCTNCGASREDSEKNYFDVQKEKEAKEAAQKAAQPQQRSASPGKSRLPLLLIIAAVIIGLFVFMNGNKTQSDLQITGLNWQRSIEIEQYLQFSESDWTLPEGAEVTSRKQEIHHYDTVLDHYETVEVQRSREVLDHYDTSYTYRDMGNGHFEEVEHSTPVYRTEYYMDTEQQPVYKQVPRFQTKYYYTIWRWKAVREETASGNAHDAAWPELNLASDEREGTRREAYRFTVENTKNKEQATYRIAESYWNQLNVNDAVFITAKRTGAAPFLSDKDGNKITDLVREQ